VLVKMGQAFFAGSFVGGTDASPDLEFDHGRAMALAKQHRQPVREDSVQYRIGDRIFRRLLGRILVQSAARVPEPNAPRPRSRTSG
jgi:hypothetical protein